LTVCLCLLRSLSALRLLSRSWGRERKGHEGGEGRKEKRKGR